jgi:hypothetical protein
VRPLSVGEVLGAGWKVFRLRFGTLVACGLVFAVPFTIAGTLIEAATNDVAFDLSTDRTLDGTEAARQGAAAARWLSTVLVLLVIVASLEAAAGGCFGREVPARDSVLAALRRLPAVAGLYLLLALSVVPFLFVALLSVAAGAVLLLPLAWLAVRLALAAPALMFERLGPVEAYGRSFDLVGGHWWRAFAVLLAVALLILVATLGLAALAAGALIAIDDSDEVVAAVAFTLVGIAVSATAYPLWASVATVLYYDLRGAQGGSRPAERVSALHDQTDGGGGGGPGHGDRGGLR